MQNFSTCQKLNFIVYCLSIVCIYINSPRATRPEKLAAKCILLLLLGLLTVDNLNRNSFCISFVYYGV